MKTELAFAALTIAFLIMKVSGVEGGTFFLTITLITWAAAYGFGGFYLFTTRQNRRAKLAVSAIYGFLLSNLVAGMLFGLMDWEGKEQMLPASVTVGTVLFVVAGVMATRKNTADDAPYYHRMLFRTGILTTVNALLLFS